MGKWVLVERLLLCRVHIIGRTTWTNDLAVAFFSSGRRCVLILSARELAVYVKKHRQTMLDKTTGLSRREVHHDKVIAGVITTPQTQKRRGETFPPCTKVYGESEIQFNRQQLSDKSPWDRSVGAIHCCFKSC